MRKRKKQKNLSKLIIFPLIGLMFILLFLHTLEPVSGDVCSCDPNRYYESETIYERVDCYDCRCSDSGRALFRFHGLDSDCESMKTESERYACYNKFNQKTYECSQIDACDALSDPEQQQKCYQNCANKYPGMIFDYYHGGPGTFVANSRITTGGFRTFFLGFDASGQHKIMTGFSDPGASAIMFRQASRDVEFGSNLHLGGDLQINSQYSGIYFDAQLEFAERNENWIKRSAFGTSSETVKTAYIKSANRGLGVDVTGYMDNYNNLMVKANDQGILRVYNPANEDSKGGVISEKGVEIGGNFRSWHLYYEAGHNTGGIMWTPNPIDGYFVLFTAKK